MRWLSYFPFTFLILAGLLFFQAYREITTLAAPPMWRVGLYCIAGGVFVGLAVQGMRIRHKRDS
ncbi:MAG: hypothetical protein ACAI43_02875 [Phycisphaerae bacterium]